MKLFLSKRGDVMERMLAVVFDNEAKAYEGSRALNQLDSEGSIALYGAQVVEKNADGEVSTKDAEGDFPIGTLGGLWIGSLIGLLAGPAGMAAGAMLGTTAGGLRDLSVADLDADFVDQVTDALTPGKYALIADVNEEWVTPVDTRMETLGGVVYRTTRDHFEADQRAREVASLKQQIVALKAEQAQARAEAKTKLQAKIDNLNKKLNEKVDEAEERSEQLQKETDAKVQALLKKAAKAQGDAKAGLEARAKQIREKYEQSRAKLSTLAA
jgi:uncharacterized membrane protein